MNFRLGCLAALLCLVACNGSTDTNNDTTSSGETTAAALEQAQAEIAAFKTNGLAQTNAEIKSQKDETANTKTELAARKAALEAVARTVADGLKKSGKTKEAAEILRQAGLLDEAEALLKEGEQIVVLPNDYEPFPPLYKVVLADGTKGLPAPKGPPMGWNSWNTFKCNVSATLILDVANEIVMNGMAKAGYDFINIDDCWAGGRDADGKLQANEKFPLGIKDLADKIHAKGLKLGIYSGGNNKTCAGYTGSLGREETDAATFASWGVDYLKYDDCNGPSDRQTFIKMRDALAKTKRNIFFSVNLNNFSNGFHRDARDFDHPWVSPLSINMDVPTVTHTARVGDDITDNFDSIKALLASARAREGYATPGFWNDPDMLEVGKLASDEENKTHFGMWAMLAAPLLTGNDIINQSVKTLRIMTNSDIIAVNQDPLNIQATVVREDAPGLQVWSKPLVNSGTRAVALLNLTGKAAMIQVKWSDLGLGSSPATVRDLSNQKDSGDFQDGYSATVPSHGVVILSVEGSEVALPSGTSYLSDQQNIFAVNGWGPVEKDESNGEEKANDGTRLQIAEAKFEKGLGVSARSQILYRPAGKCSHFTTSVGVDAYYFKKDSTERKGYGNVSFEVWGDGRLLVESGVMTPAEQAKQLDADIENVSTLRLIVKPGDDYVVFDYADWADPKITCQ
jgi:alpha-galactosidase